MLGETGHAFAFLRAGFQELLHFHGGHIQIDPQVKRPGIGQPILDIGALGIVRPVSPALGGVKDGMADTSVNGTLGKRVEHRIQNLPAVVYRPQRQTGFLIHIGRIHLVAHAGQMVSGHRGPDHGMVFLQNLGKIWFFQGQRLLSRIIVSHSPIRRAAHHHQQPRVRWKRRGPDAGLRAG